MSSPVNSPNSDDDSSRPKWHLTSSSFPTTCIGNNSGTLTTVITAISPPSSCSIINPTSSKRKSAFLPYRPPTTVLTNLQRGNTEAPFFPSEISLNFHERAGQGELTIEQVQTEIDRRRGVGAAAAASKIDGSVGGSIIINKNINTISSSSNTTKNNYDGSALIDFIDKYGFTPLHWACYYGQLSAATMLIDSGANVNYEAPEMVTPLILAACGGHHEIVRILLQNGAIANHMDIIGNTALMYAAAGNHPHTCNELLTKDPDLTTTNEMGDTAYSLAVNNNCNLLQAVLEHYLSALLTL